VDDPRCPALHVPDSGHRPGHGSLRLPESLAERALADGHRGRSGGAAGHLAGDQRARSAGRLRGHPARGAIGRAGGAARHLSGQHHRAHPAARLHLHLVRDGAVRAGVSDQRRRRAATVRRRCPGRAGTRAARAGVRGCLLPGFLPDARPRRKIGPQLLYLFHLRLSAGRGGQPHSALWRRDGGGVERAAGGGYLVGGVFLRLTLKVHGIIFMLLALTASSALEQAAGLLLGERTWPGGAPWAIWSGALTACLCYAIGTRHGAAVTPSWSSRTLRILVAGTAVLLVAG